MRKAIFAVSILAAFAFGLSLDVATYDAQNAGVVIRVKELPVCVGFETRGVIGPFGFGYADCDV